MRRKDKYKKRERSLDARIINGGIINTDNSKNLLRTKTFTALSRKSNSSRQTEEELQRSITYDTPDNTFKPRRDKSPTKLPKNIKIQACVVKIYRGHGLEQSSNYKSILASN